MKQQSLESKNRAAIYCRLSKEDETDSQSVSIGSQKMIIRNFCEENGFEVVAEFIDDGYSGLNFNRPSFQQLLVDIELKKIDIVITKDLSRFGRDYIMTGYYTDIYFMERGIRYIAIHDNYDTSKGRNEIIPFKNLLNDMYAADCSGKVKSVLTQKRANGEHIAGTMPLGYKRNPDRKNHLIIDEETAWIIRLIFDMYKKGAGTSAIRNHLAANKIMKPSAWLHNRNPNMFQRMGFDDNEEAKYIWSNDMVARILKSETYIGNTVNYRDRKATYKSKLKRQPKENWLIVPNTHEPIIDMDTWNAVQSKLGIHKKPVPKYEQNMFLGLALCPDCGTRMRISNRHDKKYKEQNRVIRFLSCARYAKYGTAACSMHSISYELLSEVVRQCINQCIEKVHIDEKKMLEQLLKQKDSTGMAQLAKSEKTLKALQKRSADIDTIIAKLYEDRALGVLPESTCIPLFSKYTAEKQSLDDQIAELQAAAEQQDKAVDDVHKFIELIKGYSHIEELNEEILNTLIDKVCVHQFHKEGKQRKQQIDIYFKFVGEIHFVP